MRHPKVPTGDRSPVDNVVEFKPKPRDEAFITLVPFNLRGARCSHKSTWVDPNKRTVECRSCGALLDPFDYLLELAHDGDRLARLYGAIPKARDELFTLEAELRKVKDRVRSWRAKVPR